jgi:hypothetical protein
MDTGSWSLEAEMYAEDELVQEFIYGIEIIYDMRAMLEMEAHWNGSEYEMSFELTRESIEYEEIEEDEVSYTPDFNVTDFKLIPFYHIDDFAEEESYSVNICILGSDLDTNVQGLELNYPDGCSYDFGVNSIYSRSILIEHNSSSDMIEIMRNYLITGSSANGTYSLRLSDYQGVSSEYSEVLSLDYEDLTPVITGYNAGTTVPATILYPGTHSFGYEFNSDIDIGTKLVFLINRTTSTVEPSDDSMAVVSDVGTLDIAGDLDSGSYEFIVAAVGFSTSAPVTDASLAGVDVSGLESEIFAATIYEVYGQNTGYVYYSSSSFIVP